MIISICQEFGWTYEEYLNQPVWFIAGILAKNEIDETNRKHQEQLNKH